MFVACLLFHRMLCRKHGIFPLQVSAFKILLMIGLKDGHLRDRVRTGIVLTAIPAGRTCGMVVLF